MYYWLFMFIAIVTEVFGTLAMKFGADGHPILGLSVMYTMLIISYLSLGIAMKRIPLAVAYGTWESMGLVLIMLCSAYLFAEPVGLVKITGIMFIVLGIIFLERGTEHK